MKTMTKKTTDWLVMAAARIEGKAMMAAARTRQVLTLAAAAAVMGLATASCSSEDGLAEEPVQQPENPAKKTYTMTVTASKGGDDSALARAMAEAGLTGGDATTRALSLSSDGKTLDATWAAGERVTVYNETKHVDLEGTLTAQTSGASTTLTGTLSGTIDVGDELSLFFHEDALLGVQDGTLQYIADNLDFDRATVTVKSVDGDGNITINEPAAVFDDKLTSIVRFTLVDKADPTKRLKPTSLSIRSQYKFTGQSSYIPIAYTLTGLTDATYTANAYAEDNGDGVLYASFHGADFNDFHMTATMPDGDTYEYVRSAVEFEVGKFYSITVKMTRLVDLSERYYIFEAQDGDVLMDELPVGYYVEIADGATVTLRDASINGYGGPGITCNGGATIILEGSNTVTGSEGQPGISVPESFTLTIKGSGSLRAEGGTYEYGGNKWGGAGIGGHPEGGNVIIEGGFITAIGGYGAPGIGGSYDSQYSSHFGTITIKNTVTSVTATKGAGAPYCIGPSKDGSCEMITFGDEDVYISSEWNDVIEYDLESDGSVIIGGLKVTKTATNVAGDTWTLTPETNN